MKCPTCKSSDTSVLETRSAEDDSLVRRRRKCLKCTKKFNTIERFEISDLQVIKRDGSKENFDREKITRGVLLACKKRPVNYEKLEKIAEEVEADFLQEGKKEITSKDIGEKVMNLLKMIDKVAYIRFVSVYRYFEGVDNFEIELNNLKD